LRDLLAAAPTQEVWAGVREGSTLVEDVLDAGHVRARLRRRGKIDSNDVPLSRRWASAARDVDLAVVAEANRAAGVAVHLLGDPGYPSALASDHEAPAVLFSRGDVAALAHPGVAIVGTRSATHYGQDVASQLGCELANAGVGVVSGLALGIDGAAHQGALAAGSAPPVGVVASGLDVIYPPRHARLWERVARAGALLSEAPLGTEPRAWRFPVRNRIIAAVAQVVVVVECHRRGGALHTVEAAIERGRLVMAVPGSVRSPASEGTNALLADGCQPVRDTDDVLAALDLERAGRSAAPAAYRPPDLTAEEGTVLAALEWRPVGTDEVMRRTEMPLEAVAVVLDRLEGLGVARGGGGYWERDEASAHRERAL
jgi:DNA processing protein